MESNRQASRDVHQLLSTIENIYHIRDLDTLLERVLSEARRFVHADAGTLYLIVGSDLYFSYVQNDTLFKGETARDKYTRSSQKMTVDKKSLAGYVAMTGESLLIDDVYRDIKSEVSYNFNPTYDRETAYRTRSILVVPLTTRDDSILGVLQLINAKDANGRVVPFSMQDRLYINQFASNAANAIEKAKLSREMILRMVELTELRDPYETSRHAKRVGAYSVELYERWALKRGVAPSEIKETRDILRTAAILHDVGKVAISDLILKKTGDLDEEEQIQMKYHTVYGARLFRYTKSPWDRMASEVALNHHERWDGKGYPGEIDDLFAPDIYFGQGKRGEKIPISARIVALADVYDSLISKRAYKGSWKEEHTVKYIRDQAGRQFDPELTRLFIKMHDVIKAIRQKYAY